jgi:DNA-binding protein WhiA
MKSFTERVREELAENLPSPQCCRRSMLLGILINADCSPDGGIYSKLSGREAAELMLKLLRDTYGREASAEYSNSYGRVSAEVVFSSEKLANKLRELSVGNALSLFKCQACEASFLAGVLLSSANLSNPDKESRIEIRINDPARADTLAGFFSELGHPPTRSYRDGVSSLILKRSEDVEDVLTIAGAVSSVMELMQGKLMRELRGQVNRNSNCEIRNIGRAAVAAKAQVEAIKEIRASGRFAALPDELKETATLREDFPEIPLSELAAKHNPPITKSGLNHRLKKLLALAGVE